MVNRTSPMRWITYRLQAHKALSTRVLPFVKMQHGKRQRRFFSPPLCFSALGLFGQLVLIEILILYFTQKIYQPSPPPSSTTLLTEKKFPSRWLDTFSRDPCCCCCCPLLLFLFLFSPSPSPSSSAVSATLLTD